ncbi:type II toxin-antitoxin system RatA family toxin [Streptomyces sp. bgisy100]|uniref:type II toxin-antitoxin system RatA family toxin n=1 Tax=Streptomyces sp. bgisy100 TaxID=3413783 RepID=UPI003D76505C
MRAVQLEVGFEGVQPQDAYARIADFERYPSLVAAVRQVTVHPGTPPEPLHSDWEVDFRNGVLSWSEADTFDDDHQAITFEQTSGDFESFTGRWQVEADGDGCLVRFEATFDFGLPSLAGIVEPVAERVLRENILAILDGLLNGAQSAAATVPGPRVEA